MVEENLNKLGLNAHEQEVYMAILKAGKISPARISVVTNINRTTVYSVGKKLVKLGLVADDFHGKTGYFMADGPEGLKAMIEKAEKEIEKKKEIVNNLMIDLKGINTKQNYSVPRIKFLEEENLNEYLYSQSDKWERSGQAYDNTWWGFHDSSFTEQYKEWINWVWERSPSDLKVKFLVNNEPIEQEMRRIHPDREVRTLKENAHFDTSLWVIGDYIIMVQSRIKPNYLVEISDPVLARNHRELFSSIWKELNK